MAESEGHRIKREAMEAHAAKFAHYERLVYGPPETPPDPRWLGCICVVLLLWAFASGFATGWQFAPGGR